MKYRKRSKVCLKSCNFWSSQNSLKIDLNFAIFLFFKCDDLRLSKVFNGSSKVCKMMSDACVFKSGNAGPAGPGLTVIVSVWFSLARPASRWMIFTTPMAMRQLARTTAMEERKRNGDSSRKKWMANHPSAPPPHTNPIKKKPARSFEIDFCLNLTQIVWGWAEDIC